jgi:hypothetical protein
MEAVCSFETPVNYYRDALCHIQEDKAFHNCPCENSDASTCLSYVDAVKFELAPVSIYKQQIKQYITDIWTGRRSSKFE